MNSKNESVKFTMDLPKDIHRKLKVIAAATGKTMRDLFVESIPYIEENNHCGFSNHMPNEETLQILKEASERKGLVKAKNFAEILKNAGID